MTRTKIIYYFMMIFTPLFLGVLFFFSPQFNYLGYDTKLLSFAISVVFIEVILFAVFWYSNKRIISNPVISKNNKNISDLKKYWWVYLIGFVLIPAIIFYWSSYQHKLFEVSSYLIQTLAGAFFIIKKPLSNSGIISEKVEFIMGTIMLVTSAALLIKELFM